MKSIRYCLLLCLITTPLFAQRWQQAASCPGPTRDGAITFAIGDKAYFGAGESKDFYEYNSTTDTWTKKANIPGVSINREFGIGFSIGNKGYVGFGVDNGALKKDLWEYDPSTDKWTKKADFIAGLDALFCFTMGGKVYVGGGTDNNYIYGEFYSYDPVINEWDSLGDLPMGAVAFASTFVIGSKAYVTGGDLGTGNGELGDLYEYTPETNSWKTLAAFPTTARQTMVGFAINGKGYVGLGQSQYKDVFADFYSYDPMTNSWTDVSGDFPISPGRAWASAIAIGDKAYIGAGWDFGSKFYNDWWKYDPSPTAIVEKTPATNQLSIYPNPVADRFMLNGSFTSGMVKVIDVLGREVCSSAITSGKGYDVSNLTKGEYLVKVESEGKTSTFKLVKN